MIHNKNTSFPEPFNSQAELEKIRSSNIWPNPCERINNIRLVEFNVERGRYLDEIEAYIKYHPLLKNADVIFFNELDDGMARSGNIDTTAELAKRLSMNYIYGTEFIELTKGDNLEESEFAQKENTLGFHGNAILSRFELIDPVLIRLPVVYDWFYDKQKRLGGRIALYTKISVNDKLIGLLCTHLENRSSPDAREKQMEFILERTKEYFNNIPVIIAGDMNTNTCDFSDEGFISLYENWHFQADRIITPEQYEPIFKLLKDAGFDFKNTNVEGKATRRKPIPGRGILDLNLDWFFVKGLKCYDSAVVHTIFSSSELEGLPVKDAAGKDGREISDHNAISVKCLLEP